MTLFSAADVFWIAKISGLAVAAVAASAFIEWTLHALTHITTTGTTTIISQYIGADNRAGIERTFKEAFYLSLLISLAIPLIALPLGPKFFSLMGLSAKTQKFALDYFNIIIIAYPINYMFHLTTAIFNAYGDTKPSTIILLSALALNIVLDPILMFGYLGFPALGIKGAAIASVFSQTVGLTFRFIYLKKYDYIPSFNILKSFSTKTWRAILHIGFPAALTNVTWSLVYPLLTMIITNFGMAPLAALNICHKLEGVPYFISMGTSIAIATLVGQRYGRGYRHEIPKILSRGLFWASFAIFLIALCFIFIPDKLIAFFIDDPVIIAHGVSYLRIIAYFEIFMGWELVTEGAFNGLGNSKPYMWLITPLTLSRVPLAYILSINFSLGINGVWWAISLTTLIKGVSIFALFYLNKKNVKILYGGISESCP